MIKNSFPNGQEETYNDDGLLHSFDDCPAKINPKGEKFWYKNGFLHRLNGPASVKNNGSEITFWLEGFKVSENVFNNLSFDLDGNISSENPIPVIDKFFSRIFIFKGLVYTIERDFQEAVLIDSFSHSEKHKKIKL